MLSCGLLIFFSISTFSKKIFECLTVWIQIRFCRVLSGSKLFAKVYQQMALVGKSFESSRHSFVHPKLMFNIIDS